MKIEHNIPVDPPVKLATLKSGDMFRTSPCGKEVFLVCWLDPGNHPGYEPVAKAYHVVCLNTNRMLTMWRDTTVYPCNGKVVITTTRDVPI